MRPYVDLFFMGAAFLLLEVQNISKASVVLGNTWVVSAVVSAAASSARAASTSAPGSAVWAIRPGLW